LPPEPEPAPLLLLCSKKKRSGYGVNEGACAVSEHRGRKRARVEATSPAKTPSGETCPCENRFRFAKDAQAAKGIEEIEEIN
jgi:hypothetical protein